MFITKHPELYQGQSGFVVPTFEEELTGRFMLADGTENCVKHGKPAPSQYLADVLRIHQAGFLKEYVWSYFNLPSWADSQQPEKLLSFITWNKTNLKMHALETHGAVKLIREDPSSGPPAGSNSLTTNVQAGGGAELTPIVSQIGSAIQQGKHDDAARLLAHFSQSAGNLRKEPDAAYCCFMSQRQLRYFLCLHPELSKLRVMDWCVALGGFLSAFLLSKSRRFNEALSELDAVLKIAPFFAQAWNEKGYILMNLRRPQEALAANTQAWDLVRRHPENFDKAGPVLRGQAVAQVELGDLDRAEKLLSDSLVVEPGNSLATQELAYIAHRRKGTATQSNTYFVDRTGEKSV
jgi:hypothetical protein